MWGSILNVPQLECNDMRTILSPLNKVQIRHFVITAIRNIAPYINANAIIWRQRSYVSPSDQAVHNFFFFYRIRPCYIFGVIESRRTDGNRRRLTLVNICPFDVDITLLNKRGYLEGWHSRR